MTTTWPLRLDVDAVDAAKQLDLDDRIALGYVGAQLACVIDANYPSLGRDRIEDLSIEFAYIGPGRRTSRTNSKRDRSAPTE